MSLQDGAKAAVQEKASHNQQVTQQSNTSANQESLVTEANSIVNQGLENIPAEPASTQSVETPAKIEEAQVAPTKTVKPWEQPESADPWGEKLRNFGIDEFVPEKVYSKFEEFKNSIPKEDPRIKDPRVQKFLELVESDVPLSEYNKFIDETDYVKIAQENPTPLYEQKLKKDGLTGDSFDQQMQIFEELTDYDKTQKVLGYAQQLTNERNSFQQQFKEHREQAAKTYQEQADRNLKQIDSILESSVGHKFKDEIDFTIKPEHIEKAKQYIRTASHVNPDGSFNAYKAVEDHLKVILFDEMANTISSNVEYATRKQEFDTNHAVSSTTQFHTPSPPDKEAQSARALEGARKRLFG